MQERAVGVLGMFRQEGWPEGGAPMTRPSSTSWCMVTFRGRISGPVEGRRMLDGGLRKKKGWLGRALESSVMWSLGWVSVVFQSRLSVGEC
jgi:hypothetical protein